MSVGGSELPLDVELPNGTPVKVAVSTHDVARRALAVFGWPLGAAAAAATVTEWFGGSETLIVAALLGTALAVVGVRAASVAPDRFSAGVSRSSAAPDEGVRVVLE
ncbi:MAG: SoxR reducing system RseC family protein [Pseudomonadales bacterium]|nr:SoxR reducing system RseC family protein [Pseudomonadales bacterium]